MPPLVVVDTNVVVAGLLTGRDDSPVARILDGMLAPDFPFALSEALLAEYGSVLRRTPRRAAHGLTLAELDIVLVQLAQHAVVLAPVPARPAPEPGDQHLWDLLAARAELLLISGDKLLLRDRAMASRVLSPAAFVERWLRSDKSQSE
jgi:predicted nucleic acid-binding protein